MDINDIQVGCKYIRDDVGTSNTPGDQQVVTAIQKPGSGSCFEWDMPGNSVRSFSQVGPQDCHILVQTASGETEMVYARSLRPLEEPGPESTS